MDNQVQEIKSKVDIVEYIGVFTQLKKTGRNFKALCPFHQEKTASFVVSPERQVWYCFGSCHQGGDILSFIMKWENVTFYEALKELADKVGVRLKDVAFEDKEWQKKERLLSINSLTARYFEYVLHNMSVGKTGLDYLLSRGLNKAIIQKFQIGYAPSSWDSLILFLKKKKFTEEDAYEAGLIVKNSRGRYYDRFRGRIIFPIFYIRGNIIGFSGRLIQENGVLSAGGKYINTPETPLYQKRHSLYGIQIAKEAIKKEGNVILVEGEFDMITPYSLGIEHIVAIKGSAVTQEQLSVLKRLTNKITLALDSDNAGEAAMQRGIEEAEKQEFEIHVVTFDSGKDPDDVARKDPTAFKKAIKAPAPIYDFLITLAQKKYPDNDAFSKKSIGDFIIPYISRIRNPIVQSYYIKKLAQLLDVSESSIQSLMRKYRIRIVEKKPFIKNAQKHSIDREDLLQRYLISVMFQHENPYIKCDMIFAIIDVDDITIPAYRKICQLFIEHKSRNAASFDSKLFVSTLPQELVAVYNELYLFSSSEIGFHEENIERLVFEVKRNALKKKISSMLNGQTSGEASTENRLTVLSTSLREVENRMHTL